MIDEVLSSLIHEALRAAEPDLGPMPEGLAIEMSRPRVKDHGDWSTNVALALASKTGQPGRVIAEAIVRHLPPDERIEKIEFAGPGFINFHLSKSWLHSVLAEIVTAGERYGRTESAGGERVQVEFVSANPTGPLHLGHGRWAAVGDALASVLEAAGHSVEREFYVNDFGNQMELFGRSIASRYLELHGREAEIPEQGYHGVYVTELAKEISGEAGERLVDASDEDRVAFFREEGERRMLAHQREVLERFGVRYDVWFSERTLHESGAVRDAIEKLRERGLIYEKDDAVWLRTTDLGDDKDRVVVKATGETTYLAPDAAYVLDKFGRGFDRLIYLWGADHHGYVGRLRAVVQALGFDASTVEFLIGQFVNLFRGAEPVRMSKRTGELVTFDELLDEVGTDPARYLFVREPVDTQINFDIAVATSQSMDNPVYYVQYAHARIASLLRVAQERGVELDAFDDASIGLLAHPSELDLLRALSDYPEAVMLAARHRAPHRVARYAEERLAPAFHRFYTDCPVLAADDPALVRARLWLAWGAR
ncbi:MAG: arginine--tRNA ligase, partial [Actinobacteria bacterium]|nr:arginine--tRNA ligase [Actinomycetota bacterium]